MNQHEKKFKNLLLSLSKQANLYIDWQEHQDRYQSGIPDLSYGSNFVNGWVELKWGDNLIFQPRQPKWLGQRCLAGGYCFVIQGNPNSVRCYDLSRKERTDWGMGLNMLVASEIISKLATPLTIAERGAVIQARDKFTPLEYFRESLGAPYQTS